LNNPSNTKFHENPSVGAKSFHADKWTDRRKDGQDAANSRFLQFIEDTYYQSLSLNFYKNLKYSFPQKTLVLWQQSKL